MPRSGSQRPTKRDRRRGRARRWLLRALLWGAAALAVTTFALTLFLESRWAEERARRLLVSYLEQKLGAAVELESLSFEMLPLGVELRGVVVGSGGSDTLPLVTVPRVAVTADVEAFFRPSLRIRRVTVERPEVSIRWLEAGSDNLVRWRRAAERSQPRPWVLDVTIDVVELSDGRLTIDDRRVPFELAARRLQARLAGRRDGSLEGQVRAAEVETRLRRGKPRADSLAVRLRLERGRLELWDGRAAAPGFEAAFEGAYRWADGERELTLDLGARAEAGLVSRWDLSDLAANGPLEIEGGLAWRPQLWGFRGTVTTRRLRFLDRDFADVVSVVSVDRNGGRVDLETAAYGDGLLAGEITVGRREDGRPVTVDLTLDGVRLSRLLEDQALPVRAVEGLVSGEMEYRFPAEASRSGDGSADLTIVPEPTPQEGTLAVRGRVRLGIEKGVVRTRTGRLASASQDVLASGFYRLDSRSGRFDFEIASRDLPPLLARIPGLEDASPPPLWLPRAGRGRLAGSLALDRGEVVTDLRLDLQDVAAPGFTATAVTGSLRAMPGAVERLWIELERPAAALLVVGDVSLAEEGEVDLAVESEGWPLDDLAAWLPAQLPATGPLSGRLELGGRLAAPRGSITARSADLEVAGIAAGELELLARFAEGRIEVEAARVTTGAGTLRLAGWVDESELALEIGSEPLDLAAPPWGELTGGRLTGAASVSGRLEGSPASPRLDLTLAGLQLAAAGRDLPASRASFSWDGERLEVQGSLLGLMEVRGGGPLDRSGARVELEVESERLAELAALALPDAPAVAGATAGRLELVAGAALENPGARLVLDRLRLTAGGRELVALEPVELEAAGEGVRIRSLWLGEPGGSGELFLAGTVAATEPFSLDLTAQSTLGPEWLQPLVPGVVLTGGRLDAIGRITGPAAAPGFNGVGTLAGVDALVEGVPSSLEGSSGVILFEPQQWVIDRAEAGFGGGRLRLGGTITFERGWKSPDYRLRLAAETVNVRYPEGWLLRGGGAATIRSTPGGRVISGRIDLERAAYTRSVDLGLAALLRASAGRRRLEVEESRELLASTEINLEVRAPGTLVVRNNLADLRGSADLSIRGSLARPVLFGRVDLDPGGTLEFSGAEYEVERGLLTFANPYRIEPVIDLVARTELRDYDVVLNLSGPPDRLQVSFDSDPPLADLEVLSLLTSGGVWSPGEARGNAGAEGFLYGQAASLLTSRANQLFGLDKLQINPLTAESGDISSVRVTLSERLSSDLVATYSYDPSTTEEEILELRWTVSRQLTTVVTQNGDGSYSVDLLWERSF